MDLGPVPSDLGLNVFRQEVDKEQTFHLMFEEPGGQAGSSTDLSCFC